MHKQLLHELSETLDALKHGSPAQQQAYHKIEASIVPIVAYGRQAIGPNPPAGVKSAQMATQKRIAEKMAQARPIPQRRSFLPIHPNEQYAKHPMTRGRTGRPYPY